MSPLSFSLPFFSLYGTHSIYRALFNSGGDRSHKYLLPIIDIASTPSVSPIFLFYVSIRLSFPDKWYVLSPWPCPKSYTNVSRLYVSNPYPIFLLIEIGKTVEKRDLNWNLQCCWYINYYLMSCDWVWISPAQYLFTFLKLIYILLDNLII